MLYLLWKLFHEKHQKSESTKILSATGMQRINALEWEWAEQVLLSRGSPLGHSAESVQKGSSSQFQRLWGPGWPRGMRSRGRDIELVRNFHLQCKLSVITDEDIIYSSNKSPGTASPSSSAGTTGQRRVKGKNGTKPWGEVAEHMATEVLFLFLLKTDIFEHLLRARHFTRICFLC